MTDAKKRRYEDTLLSGTSTTTTHNTKRLSVGSDLTTNQVKSTVVLDTSKVPILSSDEVEKEQSQSQTAELSQSTQHIIFCSTDSDEGLSLGKRMRLRKQLQMQNQTPLSKVLTTTSTGASELYATPEPDTTATSKTNNQEQQTSESHYTEEEDEEEAAKPSHKVLLEIKNLEDAFPTIVGKYRIKNKIGEGTFSTVYLAEDLKGLSNINSGATNFSSPAIKTKVHGNGKENNKVSRPLVALKRIYVTSSPQRIYNELQLLHSLVGCRTVAPLIDAIRYEDQVIAVLPFYRHSDFRDFFRDLPLSGIKEYMRQLMEALVFVHQKRIIHRDIKPTNFLYNPFTRSGVLVDFGLAERETETDPSLCPCCNGGLSADEIAPANAFPNRGYLKDDHRSGRRANRAGTRGFRAPEVLFKCANQTTKIDIWSVGVILLCLLSRRFPFFNSTDDIEALSEMALIFGTPRMKKR
ncbi:unnamed protein product [Ambrosiozyma monospora]|uniref:Unnamed protein product n=1 Tax=Ambrosiozyma monospora TaxID=43982 RepID=A0ACB5T1G4_AMBMO|nr:unnamed protein product [Ambrosiozyma monospora]